jgi:hypothetical protein
MPISSSAPLAPLFRVSFGQPIWRLVPAPGLLAVELRHAAAQTVDFVVVTAHDGLERFRYHAPATPWWLTIVGLTPDALLLAELDPNQLGRPSHQRKVPLSSMLGGNSHPAEDFAPPLLQTPAVYPATSPHFAALAQFVAHYTGQVPTHRIEYLEFGAYLIIVADQPTATAETMTHELLICAASTGALRCRTTLGTARLGPEAGLFCTFGPILYALGVPGEVIAWELPAA